MRRPIAALALSLLALALAGTCAAQEDQAPAPAPQPAPESEPEKKPRARVPITTGVGVLLPSQARVRRVFGSQVVQFSFPRPGGIGALPRQGRFTFDVDALNAEEGRNQLFLLPFRVAYERAFARLESGNIPYVRVGAGIAYADYSFRDQGRKFSNKRGLPTANITGGVVINRRLRLEGAYNWFGDAEGFRFDGLSFSATFEIARF